MVVQDNKVHLELLKVLTVVVGWGGGCPYNLKMMTKFNYILIFFPDPKLTDGIDGNSSKFDHGSHKGNLEETLCVCMAISLC